MEDQAPTFLDLSLCKDCEHMIMRLIEPLDPADFFLDEEEFKEGQLVEQITCLILNMDISYKILKCNKYQKVGKTNRSLISTRIFEPN